MNIPAKIGTKQIILKYQEFREWMLKSMACHKNCRKENYLETNTNYICECRNMYKVYIAETYIFI